MNELMVLTVKALKARDKALEQIAERQIENVIVESAWDEQERARVFNKELEREIEKYYEQAEGDFEIEEFEL